MTATQRNPAETAVVGFMFRTLMDPLLGNQQRSRRDQFEETGAPPYHVVFLGDSISEGGNWDEWFPGVPVLNRGIAGETSTQVLTRLDSAIRTPRAVFLLIGTNDLMSGTSQSRIAANISGILTGIEQRASGTPVFVQSVMPRALKFAHEVRRLNDALREVVEGHGTSARYVDLWPALAMPDGRLRPEFTRDDLHLNGSGYRAWVEVLRPLVTETGGPREIEWSPAARRDA